MLQHYAPWISTRVIQMLSNNIVKCSTKGAWLQFKACQNDCASGSTCLEEHRIFSHTPWVQSDLDVIAGCQQGTFTHSELRSTLHACLIQYMQELDSDEKVGNDESCHVYSLQIPFIPVPNSCKLLMIPTVKWKQQIWLCQTLSCGVWLLTCLMGFQSWKNQCVFNTA